MGTLGLGPTAPSFPVEETLDLPLSPGPLCPGLVQDRRTGGKQPRSQTERSGNWGKDIFHSGPAPYSFARAIRAAEASGDSFL